MESNKLLNRRIFLKDIAIWGAASCLLSSCIKGPDKQAKRMELLRGLVETILPTFHDTELTIAIQRFVLIILKHCRPAGAFKLVMHGIDDLANYSQTHSGIAFQSMTLPQRIAMIQELLENKEAHRESAFCLMEIRQLVIMAYKQSEHYLTRVMHYRMIPGHFSGCIPID